jgi:hypothetical protein
MSIVTKPRVARMLAATVASIGLALGLAGTAHAEQLNTYWNTNPEGVAGASGEGSQWKTTSGSNWRIYVSGTVWDTAGDSRNGRIRIKIRNSGGQVSYYRTTTSGGHGSSKGFTYNFYNVQKIWITECAVSSVWGEDCGKEWQIYSRF